MFVWLKKIDPWKVRWSYFFQFVFLMRVFFFLVSVKGQKLFGLIKDLSFFEKNQYLKKIWKGPLENLRMDLFLIFKSEEKQNHGIETETILSSLLTLCFFY